MTAELSKQFRRLMAELLIEREFAGGDLPVETEAEYAERLEHLWWQLSREDRAAYEAELASTLPPASQESLNLVDCEISQGDESLPRRKAA